MVILIVTICVTIIGIVIYFIAKSPSKQSPCVSKSRNDAKKKKKPTGALPKEGSRLFIVTDSDQWTKEQQPAVQAALEVHDNTTDNSVYQSPITIAFTKGTYEVDLSLTYFTALVGLGTNADDVTISGSIRVEGHTGSISNVFFRSLTNLTFIGNLLYGSSQMCPIRFCSINGNCSLSANQRAINVYGCGGFMADTTVTGQVSLQGAQQFGFKNVNFASYEGGQMNSVFIGDSKIGESSPGEECGTAIPQIVGDGSVDAGQTQRTIPKITGDGSDFFIDGNVAKTVSTLKELTTWDFKKHKNVILQPVVFAATAETVVLTVAEKNVTIVGLGWADSFRRSN